MKRALLLAVVSAVGLSGTAYAHHSFAASYFENQHVTLKGEMVSFDFKNPHAIVHLMVPDTFGNRIEYTAEWAGATRLQAQGVSNDTLKIGDYLVIAGAPARDPDQHRVHLKSIQRPADGWTWSGGYGPPQAYGRRR